jgi:glycosyltransferase involved in cell wall biosynthesis
MSLSLVITTYNRSAVLERLLRTLESQTDPDFQVVVAIDGSTDNTEDMLKGVRTHYDLKWINTHCKEYGLAVARNRGILASDARAVAIMDDDSVPVPGFVAAHKASCTPGVIGGGPRHPANGDERMAWKMQELGRLPPLTPMTIDQLQREWPNAYLVENNICLLRDDWIGMGLFSERLKLYGYIGQEYFARARFLGMRYQFNPAAAVMHHGELEGDNGFLRSRKQRQTRLATLLRPSLLTPRHFLAQIAWAKSQAQGVALSLPPFVMHAALNFPWRAARMAASEGRRAIRTRLKGR